MVQKLDHSSAHTHYELLYKPAAGVASRADTQLVIRELHQTESMMEEKLPAIQLTDTTEGKNQQQQSAKKNEELVVNDCNLRGRPLGGIRTMPFILANEVCDRFASGGFHANMISYLTQELNLPLVKASNTLTNFGGTSSFTPLIGALIADSFAGRFWTIVVGSIFYQLGLVSITISAVLPSLQPPPCPTKINCQEASSSQLWVLYAALLLTSIGSGGIRPCVLAFAADQFESTNSITSSQNGFNFFNIYYFCMGMASLTAITVVVYIQDNVGWGIGLGIPTIAMGLSLVIFLLGGPLYKKLRPGGSPLTRLAQVIVSAARKRKLTVPYDSSKLYVNKELDAAISVCRDLHAPEQAMNERKTKNNDTGFILVQILVILHPVKKRGGSLLIN